MKKILSVILTIVMLFSMAVSFSGCAKEAKAVDLMDGVKGKRVEKIHDLTEGSVQVTDFAVRLLQANMGSEANTLISPLSVLCALAMTANGAGGETLSQMEAVLGMSIEDLNSYIYSYVKDLPQGDAYKLSLANSIWFQDDPSLSVKPEFLQTNADYYGADMFKVPFNQATLRDINTWVKEHTDEMIPKILDRIPEDSIMYLINALAFDAQWQSNYEKYQVQEGVFTLGDGTEKKTDFMYSEERLYLEDGYATGFIKYYKDRKYAFVALLPNQDVTTADYIATLSGAHLSELLANPANVSVYTSIPKFESEYSVELSEALKGMGMLDAFDMSAADFSGLGTSEEGNIYIGRVLHKTFISVGEQGTKAGAVTAVDMACGSAMNPEEPKTVYLDRPFVYMLIDCENNVPFFIGTMMDVSK